MQLLPTTTVVCHEYFLKYRRNTGEVVTFDVYGSDESLRLGYHHYAFLLKADRTVVDVWIETVTEIRTIQKTVRVERPTIPLPEIF